MALPLSLEDDDYPVMLLSDSEDDDESLCLPATRYQPHDTPKVDTREHPDDAMPKQTEDATANAPLHPIPAMQSAFAESLMEATTNAADLKPKLRFADAKGRRARLLEASADEELQGDLWRRRPGQQYHELWKLMAQISFGVYLLLNGIANSNIQVVNILQGHIDEVDEFLETAMEDILLAIDDVHERIDFLKVPMENRKTFERMLEDRAFRLQIVTGNEKIEHVCNRTTAALEAYLADIDEGLKATKEFAGYLRDQQDREWRQERPDVVDIFDAMKGNAEGWYKAFVDLQDNAAALEALQLRLVSMVSEMNRIAGDVSRKPRVSAAAAYQPAFQLDLRASALQPLQFSIAPFSGTPAVDASHMSEASGRSSPRSSSSRSRAASDAPSLPHSEPTSTKSPPSSPWAKDILPPLSYQPPTKRESISRRGPALQIQIASEPEPDREMAKPTPVEEEDGLYILQPRTYTPLPPAPLPSPLIREPRQELPGPEPEPELELESDLESEPESEPEPEPEPAPQPVPIQKKTSLRQRLSLRGSNPPESIPIPPRNGNRPRQQQPPPQQLRQQPARAVYAAPESTYDLDGDRRLPTHSGAELRPPAHSMVDLRPPTHSMVDPFANSFSPPVFPNTIPSPFSDQQHFRPVQASPHSPLQRPWTAGTPNMVQRPHTSATHRQYGNSRGAPSAMGMSTMSNVPSMSQDGKTLKKKRSAFGWLKKAFALDEEERLAFEARKQQQTPNLYYDERSPKFLDGKRREDYRRH